MHFPYVHDKRFDGPAVRFVAHECSEEVGTISIVEPLTTSGDLRRYLQALDLPDRKTIVICNPWQEQREVGARSHANDLEALYQLVTDTPHVVPGFQVTARTKLPEIRVFLDAFPKREVMLLYPGR